MTRPISELLQESPVEKHRQLLAQMLGGVVELIEQPDLHYYIFDCDAPDAVADRLKAQGVPAAVTLGTVFVFDNKHPFYAQHRLCINKVGLAILEAVVEVADK